MHAQRSFPATRLPDTLFATGWAEWAAVTRQSPRTGVSPYAAPLPPRWTLIGPAGLDYAGSDTPNMGPAAGRTTALAIDPTNTNVIYAGFAMGGVWKTTDGGTTWKSLTDDQPSLAVGAIVLDANAPSTVYVGLGEGNLSGDSYLGLGALKSTDGGATWAMIGTDSFSGLSIAKMFSDPSGALYAGTVQGIGSADYGCQMPQQSTRVGLYKSTDGGTTWKQTVAGQQVTDFEIDTTATPRTGFLSSYKVGAFRFDESTQPAKLTPLSGLPSAQSGGPITRIELAQSKSNPQIMYAGVGLDTSPDPSTATGRGTVYRSMDGGNSWSEIAGSPDFCADQCMYDNVVEVDPTNPAVVYLGGSVCSIFKMSNATSSGAYSIVSLPNGGTTCGSNWVQGNVHSDAHAIVFHPTTPGTIFTATDGGIARSTNGGTAWTKLNSGISTLQFWNLCVDPNDDSLVVGGLQDNGVIQMPQTGNKLLWKNFIAGDGCSCVLNLADPTPANRFLLTSTEIGFATYQTSLGAKPQDSFVAGEYCMGQPPCGDPVAFVAPIATDVHSATTVYTVTNKVFKSTTGGATPASWKAISSDLTSGKLISCTNGRQRDDVLTAVAASGQRVYAGSFSGIVSTSGNGGATWSNVTKAPLPNRYITDIAVDPAKAETVYVAFSGFDAITPGTPGHIFRSTDAGATWSRADLGMNPLDMPINAIRVHPDSSDILFAATDLGVVATGDGGATWQPLGTGLPAVLVYSLVYHRKTSKVYASTHGRSAWSLQLTPSVTANPAMLRFTTKPGQIPAAQTIQIVNGDNFGSTLQFTAASGAGWLSITPDNGRAIGAKGVPLTASVAIGAMGIGEYDTSIAVTDMNAMPASASIPVHLSVTPTGVEPDAGGGGGSGGAGVDGGSTTATTGGGTAGGGTGPGAGATTGAGGTTATSGTTGGSAGATGGSAATPPRRPSSSDDGGCGCRIERRTDRSLSLFEPICAVVAILMRRRTSRVAAKTLII